VAVGVYSQSQFCSDDGTCFSLVIPAVSNVAGVEFLATMLAPASHKWFAIGLGNQMAGTLMLVAWPNGNDVTLSSRLAK